MYAHCDCFGDIWGQFSSVSVSRMSSKVIVVTGFGPFQGHEQVNASWEAVRQLPDVLELGGVEYSIRKMEIPVSYDDVELALKDVWALDPLVSIS